MVNFRSNSGVQEPFRPGSYIPEDLLAAVGLRCDVVLVEQHAPELAPTPRIKTIAYDGLPAIVERGGRVLALMTCAQWEARPPDCRWKLVPPPGTSVQLPGHAPTPPATCYLKPRRGARGDEPIDL